jgi:hypothetical protein
LGLSLGVLVELHKCTSDSTLLKENLLFNRSIVVAKKSVQKKAIMKDSDPSAGTIYKICAPCEGSAFIAPVKE